MDLNGRRCKITASDFVEVCALILSALAWRWGDQGWRRLAGQP